ncbi:alpha/beta hydrolase [Enterococcus avium]|nr:MULTISPECIES: alpha/beta hydrolase [Enterococcus]MDD9141596.1 alpha/beta hydrolase [Enterococcus avium]OFT72940.1 alpha/beta hydrolase [Enterococcus sp. HMSC05C03]RGY41688.1 alpha/beta hydrolase [Enterococcus avium]
MGYLIMFVVLTIICIEFYLYKKDMKNAYARLNQYNVNPLITSFGKMNYLDEGSGETVIISHGIFGGYDQGITSLNQVLGEDYRKIAPARFGYLGSELPSDPTPKNQAQAFVEMMDQLNIEKGYILATSAGGAAGLRMALDYPDRLKGLILLSSGAPDQKRTSKEIKAMGLQGPPPFIVNDFIMWFSMKHFGFVFNKMMGSTIESNNLFETMLPATPRRQGVKADSKVTDTDMSLNYDDYALETISVPILVCHAKDDPMAKYEAIEKLLKRVKADTIICETGGHTIDGNGDVIDQAIRGFIEKTS